MVDWGAALKTKASCAQNRSSTEASWLSPLEAVTACSSKITEAFGEWELIGEVIMAKESNLIQNVRHRFLQPTIQLWLPAIITMPDSKRMSVFGLENLTIV